MIRNIGRIPSCRERPEIEYGRADFILVADKAFFLNNAAIFKEELNAKEC